MADANPSPNKICVAHANEAADSLCVARAHNGQGGDGGHCSSIDDGCRSSTGVGIFRHVLQRLGRWPRRLRRFLMRRREMLRRQMWRRQPRLQHMYDGRVSAPDPWLIGL